LGTTETFQSLHWFSTTSEGPGRSSSNHSCFSERLQSGKVASIRDYSVLFSRRPHHGSYALRISSKRLGPVNEFLGLARSQIEIELNSTTDDLLIDVANNKIHHGGNSQAFSIISSTEKTRLSLDKIGRLLFVQSTEFLDAGVAYNLPPHLAANDPTASHNVNSVDLSLCSLQGFRSPSHE
jgi:phenylalanine ammonia-lyase